MGICSNFYSKVNMRKGTITKGPLPGLLQGSTSKARLTSLPVKWLASYLIVPGFQCNNEK